MIRVVITSPSAAVRVQAIDDRLRVATPEAPVWLVGASRAAADECAARVAHARGGLFGVTRTSLIELVMRFALPSLARRRVAPASGVGLEAVVTRARYDAQQAAALRYFTPVADTPGFPRAAARTLDELQMAAVSAATLTALDDAGADLATLLQRVEQEADRAGTVTRAGLWRAAIAALAAASRDDLHGTLVLLDVAITSAVEEHFVAALLEHFSDVTATVPEGDTRTLDAWSRLGFSVDADSNANAPLPKPSKPQALPALQPSSPSSPKSFKPSKPSKPSEPFEPSKPQALPALQPSSPSSPKAFKPSFSALDRLQQYLFSAATPPAAAPDATVSLFSAPGEGREAVEVARRILAEAARGVPFDDMAVLLRAPHTYAGLIEHALSRAGIPAWFERGTRRPDPAGRAFLALLACADEQLSARRFAEYLSLAQVPSSPAPADAEWSPPTDDVVSSGVRADERAEDPPPLAEAPAAVERDGDRVVAGTLRAPWRWEELLVEAYVIRGLDRWQKRLRGLTHEYDMRIRELRDEDEDSPRIAALERDREELTHLETFALPIVRELDQWREPRPWGEWLAAFEAMAPRVLRQPARVRRVLGELTPLGAIGPVTLAEVRDVLTPRLLTLTHEPARRRHGRVFVGTPAAARGRVFRVVFVPGLAERVFPQRLREDALLLDRRRRVVDKQLAVADVRADEERLQLRLAVGAARERVFLSYPRLELGESRPRVPSFYVLDVVRAITGVIPRYADLAEQAAREGGASLAWPAPADPVRAIDTVEHDLAVLLPLLRDRRRASSDGRARYLIQLNEPLRRSVTERWARWQHRWHPADGLIRVTPATTAALDAQRLTKRPYSLTALQRFSSCPYQFLLAAVYRLAPLEEPAPLQYMDPLTRGSLFHAVQTDFLRVLAAAGQLPVDESRLPRARAELRMAINRVTGTARDKLAPAIDRVWNDEVDAMTRDLTRWVDEQLTADGRTWTPERFELAFGLPPDPDRDPASSAHPAVIDGRFLLRGSIDLVERKPRTRILRVTDHKTGKNRTNLATIVDGGRALQPVLYGLALENLTGELVEEGRLSYCTTAGRFTVHHIPLDVLTRRRGVEVLEIIDRAIERGTLAARPSHGACTYCDFVGVCGPAEETRTLRKPAELFVDLDELRKLP
ncbi:MAG: PD-(D/E)XK nuclease family protein [Acidobacteria bacterium]|nr:PD-(D/E)XK nuclease family protein [Acidobacteriota bacterium]